VTFIKGSPSTAKTGSNSSLKRSSEDLDDQPPAKRSKFSSSRSLAPPTPRRSSRSCAPSPA
jgi:hypothetical protein